MLDDIERDIDRNWMEVFEGSSEFFYGSVFEVLDKIIVLNKKNRELKKEWSRERFGRSGYINYLSEFCTVIFDIGRQVGKTNYIRKTAKENDAIIVLKEQMKYQYRDFNNVFSYTRIMNNEHVFGKFENIFVDEFSSIQNHKNEFLSYLYHTLGRYNINQTFILLG
jgi:hypothetical protein